MRDRRFTMRITDVHSGSYGVTPQSAPAGNDQESREVMIVFNPAPG
jgi:hypothetical protein